jgi:hypothetical protein
VLQRDSSFAPFLPAVSGEGFTIVRYAILSCIEIDSLQFVSFFAI